MLQYSTTEKTPHNKDTLTKILISAKDEVLSLGYELPVSAWFLVSSKVSG